MHLYRTDRPALARLAALQSADDAGAAVLHPPTVAQPYRDPSALAAAYQAQAARPAAEQRRPAGPATIAPAMGAGGRPRSARPRSLYRGLRPVALRLLIDLAARVRALSRVRAPLRLRLVSTRPDGAISSAARRFAVPSRPPPGTRSPIERRYAGSGPGRGAQAVLDRLQSLQPHRLGREPDTMRSRSPPTPPVCRVDSV